MKIYNIDWYHIITIFEKKKEIYFGTDILKKLKYIYKCIIMKQSLCYTVYTLKKELISVNTKLEDLYYRMQNFESILNQKDNRIQYLEVLSYGANTTTMGQLSLQPLSLQDHPDIVVQKKN